MKKNIRLANLKINTITDNYESKNQNQKLSSIVANSKVYNNIYLSPNKKNSSSNLMNDDASRNHILKTNNSNNGYNSNVLHTEELRSQSYGKYKPASPSPSSIPKNKFITKSTSKDPSIKRLLSPNSNTRKPNNNNDNSRMATDPSNMKSPNKKVGQYSFSTRNGGNTGNPIIQTNFNKNAEIINVADLMGAQNNAPISINNLGIQFPNYESPKCSVKSLTTVKAYSANTNQGIIRTYNEDRVSIILNIIRPSSYKGDIWPRCSFFGVFDGHGGSSCADFLRDNLHQYIIKDPSFPKNPNEALQNGFENAELDFINNHAMSNDRNEIVDRSGSCAIIAILVDDICYIANVGDSRALLSSDLGKNLSILTTDHKPNEEKEIKRILENQGKVYQTQTPAKNLNLPFLSKNTNQVLVGPYRVFPGRLSVSRTFGDAEAKLPKFGGLPGVIVATPEITCFKITDDIDFLMLGCDGIFDQMNNHEVIEAAWLTTAENVKAKNIHLQCGLAVDMIIRSSLVRRTFDNVTVVLVAFKNFEKIFEEEKKSNNIQTQPSNTNQNIYANTPIHTTAKYNNNNELSNNSTSPYQFAKTEASNGTPIHTQHPQPQQTPKSNNHISQGLKTPSNNVNIQEKINSLLESKKPKIRNMSEIIEKNNYLGKGVPTSANKNSNSNYRYKKSEENALQYFKKSETGENVENLRDPIMSGINSVKQISKYLKHDDNNEELGQFRTLTEANHNDKGSTDGLRDTFNFNRNMNRSNKMNTINQSSINNISATGIINNGHINSNSNTQINANPSAYNGKSGLSLQKNHVNSHSSLQSTQSKNYIISNTGSILKQQPNASSLNFKILEKKAKRDIFDGIDSLGKPIQPQYTHKRNIDRKNLSELFTNYPLTTKNNNLSGKLKESALDNLKKTTPLNKNNSYKK